MSIFAINRGKRNRMLSQSHIIGRMIAVAEYAAGLAGKPMSKEDIASLIARPSPRLLRVLSEYSGADRRPRSRLKYLIGIEEVTNPPRSLTELQQVDAWNGYHGELSEIRKAIELTTIRAKAALSQEEFAAAVGMRRSTVAGIESHRQNCKRVDLEAARALLAGAENG